MSFFPYSCLLGKVSIHFLYVPRLFDISSGLQLSRYPPRLLHEKHIRHEPGHYWLQIPLPETENTIITNGKFTLLLKRFSMGCLWYSNILTWIQGFRAKLQSFFCLTILRNKQNTIKYRSLSIKSSTHLIVIVIGSKMFALRLAIHWISALWKFLSYFEQVVNFITKNCQGNIRFYFN